MIAPLVPATIKGFLWYQGETNSALDRAPYYKTLFSALIGDWRSHFAQGNLPFLYVQISSFNSPDEDWGAIRDAQRRTLDVANTAMAVTLDIGNATNVHPSDKQTVPPASLSPPATTSTANPSSPPAPSTEKPPASSPVMEPSASASGSMTRKASPPKESP